VTDRLFGTPSSWIVDDLASWCRRGDGDIQTGPFGSQLHAADYRPVGIPSIMPVNIGENRVDTNGIARVAEEDALRLSRYRVRAGDIIYSRRGDVTKRATIRESEEGWLCGTGCLRVRAGRALDPVWLSYYLAHPAVREWIQRHAVGATMANLNTSILGGLPVSAPPPTQQRAVGIVLGRLDDLIALNKSMGETLEQVAETVFRSRFVDFDDADRLVESELGHIPAEWRVRRFADVITILSGGTPATGRAEFWGGQVPWVSVGDAHPGPWIVATDKHITDAAILETRVSKLPAETVVISARGTVGNVALMAEPMAMNQSCYGLRTRTESDQIHLYFLTRHLVNELRSHAHGSVFSTITRDTFGGIPVVCPPASELRRFEEDVRPLFQRILIASRESQTLASLRDALLPKLISGEIRASTLHFEDEMA
jgi:type I restriction enzyme, S subunit